MSKLLEAAEQCIDIPYIWGGKTTSGFDCSGFVTHVLGIDPNHNAQSLCNIAKPIASVQELLVGDLVFFGKTHVTHVMMFAGLDNPQGHLIGATGGDESCTTIEIAESLNACVKYVKHIFYRPDVLSYGRIAQKETTHEHNDPN